MSKEYIAVSMLQKFCNMNYSKVVTDHQAHYVATQTELSIEQIKELCDSMDIYVDYMVSSR